MTQLQKLTLERSRIRQRLSEISKIKESLTPEIRQEQSTLETQFDDVEAKYRSAFIAEGEKDVMHQEDTQGREIRQLHKRVSLSSYLGAAIAGTSLDGAEAELNDALELRGDSIVASYAPGGVVIPMRLFAPARETRQTTDEDTTTSPRRWLDRLFSMTAGRHLGLTYESVPAGVASFPQTTVGGVPVQRGRRQAAADAAWSISVAEMKPTRLSLPLVYTVEDAARVPGLSSALRRDIASAMVERQDYILFRGDSGANEDDADVDSIFDRSGIIDKELTQAQTTLWPDVLARFSELNDGLHASREEDLKIVASVGFNTLMTSTRATTNRNETMKWVLNGQRRPLDDESWNQRDHGGRCQFVRHWTEPWSPRSGNRGHVAGNGTDQRTTTRTRPVARSD